MGCRLGLGFTPHIGSEVLSEALGPRGLFLTQFNNPRCALRTQLQVSVKTCSQDRPNPPTAAHSPGTARLILRAWLLVRGQWGVVGTIGLAQGLLLLEHGWLVVVLVGDG